MRFPVKRLRLAAAILVAAASSTGATPPTLEALRDRHRMAAESIHTLTCDVEVTTPKDGRLETTTGRYARGTDETFVRWQFNGRVRECVVRGTTLQNLSKSQGVSSDGSGSINRHDGEEVTHCDIWARGLLHLPLGNDPTFQPLDRYLSEASWIGKPVDDVVDGTPVVAIDVAFDRPGVISWRWTGRVAFDPAANWLARRVTLNGTNRVGETLTCVYEVKQFQEVAKAIYFPVVAERRLIEGVGSEELLYRITAKNVVVNRPVSPETFRITFPHGSLYHDRIQGIRYTVDSQGRQITPAEPIPGHNAKASRSTVATPKETPPRPPTEREPTLRTAYILPAALGLLALAGSVKCVRLIRQRRGRASTD